MNQKPIAPGALRDHWTPHETLRAAPDFVSLLERLAGFAALYASDSSLDAGGAELINEARAAVRAARGEQ